MIISTDTENNFEKIQHPFLIKIFNELRIKMNLQNSKKDTCKNPTAHIYNYARLKILT